MFVSKTLKKKKKNQSDKEIIDQVQKQNPSDHPEVNNSAQISDVMKNMKMMVEFTAFPANIVLMHALNEK